MPARVATASETVACERAVIESGTSAYTLMRRAGERAATLIESQMRGIVGGGVALFAGSGNNGGDAWVVADQLTRRGIACRVASTGDPRTAEAKQARTDAIASGVSLEHPALAEMIVVDGLLGTGSTGVPRGEAARWVDVIAQRRRGGASVVALDLPSGLNATTGEHDGSVTADLTVTFGTIKRGHLLARDVCGSISVADIGLDSPYLGCLPRLVDDFWVRPRVPPIPTHAHKGTRKTLAVIGGGKGMAGAAILAGEGALRAGIGLVRVVVAEGNEIAIHAGLPAAIVNTWPRSAAALESLLSGVDAVAIGPGLGRTSETRDLVERVLLAWSGPVVVDADALNVFEGDTLSLAQLLRGRPAAITPHPAELGRLLGVTAREVNDARFDVGIELAVQLGAAVLLKGSPTVVFAPSGERYVSAAGTAALGTGGSGDVLTGMTGTLLAQMHNATAGADAAVAAACAAFVHGRAAEICGPVRGTTLSDILEAMPQAWFLERDPLPDGVIAQLEWIR